MPNISQTQLNTAIQLALETIAQYAAENGKTSLQVIQDSNLFDDATLAHALAFQAELEKP